MPVSNDIHCIVVEIRKVLSGLLWRDCVCSSFSICRVSLGTCSILHLPLFFWHGNCARRFAVEGHGSGIRIDPRLLETVGDLTHVTRLGPEKTWVKREKRAKITEIEYDLIQKPFYFLYKSKYF